MSEPFPLIPILFLLAVAAFFSASETALFSLSRFQLRQLKQKSPEKFARVKHLLDRPAALVATVLLGNELANVLTSHLLANFYEGLQLSSFQVTIVNLVTVLPMIMVFGEITPKVLAAKANLGFTHSMLTPLWWFYRASFPVRFLLENFVNFLTRGFRKRAATGEGHIREDDILQLLEEGKKKGAIHSVEQDIIENLFDIDDDRVLEIATPINDCLTAALDESPKSVIEKLNKGFHSRIPVRGENPGEIAGILYAKDLLNHINRDDQEMKVRHLMKEALFVPANMKVEVVFRRLRQMKKHIAVVEDRAGRAVAVVTMEDILEQMFGELWEEGK